MYNQYFWMWCFNLNACQNGQKYKLHNKTSLSERKIVGGHGCHTALHFGVKAKENQDKVPTLYWLPKLHKKPYKARFIANSSSCTTTELSKLLTLCLTAVKKHVIKYCEKVYERSSKNYLPQYLDSDIFKSPNREVW